MLYQLLADMEGWKTNLPDHLKFRGPDTPRNAGAYDVSPIFGINPILNMLFCFRFTAFPLCLCLHDVLACFHANKLYVSCSS